MHPLFQKATGLTETIIAAAIEVHRDKRPGLIESIYEWCLLKELGLRGLGCVSQKSVLIEYKGFKPMKEGKTNSQIQQEQTEKTEAERETSVPCSLLFKSARGTATPYEDNRPLKVAGKPEIRED